MITNQNMSFESGPVIIGGVGGSGTRVLSKLAQGMNIHMGQCLNEALDNLWFSALFVQPRWTDAIPAQEVQSLLDLFAQGSLNGFREGLSSQAADLIEEYLPTSRLAQRNPDLGAAIKQDLFQANGIEKSKFRQWGWKEPNSHIFIPQISAYFPNARYILTVRNGLDMAFSNNQNQVRLWGRRFQVETDNSSKVSPPQSLKYWLAANALARRNLETLMPGRWLEVRYENLLLNPVAEIDRIAEFVGASIDTETSQKLYSLVEPQATVGRFRTRGLDSFHPDQIDAVKALGFDVD